MQDNEEFLNGPVEHLFRDADTLLQQQDSTLGDSGRDNLSRKRESLKRSPRRLSGLAAPHALDRDRRSFLKDMGLLALASWSLYDRWRNPVAHSSQSASEEDTASPSSVAVAPPSREVIDSAPALVLPIEDFRIRSLPSSRLPNAARTYRQGHHEGMDLYAPYGTLVHAVADGTVTRADENFTELDPKLHRRFLEASAELRITPSDILDRLRGRCIEIDHGVRQGVRWRSVYAHLSRVYSTVGSAVVAGEVIAQVGNSGTTAGVKGSHDDAHLHLEIRFQAVGSSEMYLGEGLSDRQIRRLLEEFFHA